ncbi:DUF3325 family protein [Cupriavidus basilensis]
MMALISMPPALAASATLALCYAGMASLSLAMDRHHGQIWRRDPAPRHAGCCAAAAGCCSPWRHGPACAAGAPASAPWSGAGSLCAGALAYVLMLAYHPRTAAALALPATVFAAASLAVPA